MRQRSFQPKFPLSVSLPLTGGVHANSTGPGTFVVFFLVQHQFFFEDLDSPTDPENCGSYTGQLGFELRNRLLPFLKLCHRQGRIVALAVSTGSVREERQRDASE